MNKLKVISLSLIVIFFVTVGLLVSLEVYGFNNSGNEIKDVTNGNNNTTVLIEFYVSAYECESCDEAKEIIDNEIKPVFKENITITTYPSDNPQKYPDYYDKWVSYDFKVPPNIVIKNLSSGRQSKLSYGEIITPGYLKAEIEKHISGNYTKTDEEKNPVIDIFGFNININDLSLPVITIVIAGLDSINPCSFFVLLFLLSILLYTKSRKRMILIGSVFIFFSGLIYFLLMTAVLTVVQYIGLQMIIFAIAGIIAMIFGGLNIKDFFFYKKGPSTSLSEGKKKGLFRQIRKIVKIKSMPSLFIASVIFAVSANTVDLLCSFNLPVIYTSFLSSQDLSGMQYYLYIFAYNVIYVIPLLIIALIMIITLGRWKLTEFQGRILKLFSGLMIFSLGEILIINPNLLNNIFTAIVLVLICVLLTFVISFLYKKCRISL